MNDVDKRVAFFHAHLPFDCYTVIGENGPQPDNTIAETICFGHEDSVFIEDVDDLFDRPSSGYNAGPGNRQFHGKPILLVFRGYPYFCGGKG